MALLCTACRWDRTVDFLYNVFDCLEKIVSPSIRPQHEELPPDFCLALCQNLPPLQQRGLGTHGCTSVPGAEAAGRDLSADCSWQQPWGAFSGYEECEKPQGNWGRSPLQGRAVCSGSPGTTPSCQHQFCMGGNWSRSWEGLPAPRLPQFAGCCVTQTADEDKLAASHPQKHPQHQPTFLSFPGCHPAIPRLT